MRKLFNKCLSQMKIHYCRTNVCQFIIIILIVVDRWTSSEMYQFNCYITLKRWIMVSSIKVDSSDTWQSLLSVGTQKYTAIHVFPVDVWTAWYICSLCATNKCSIMIWFSCSYQHNNNHFSKGGFCVWFLSSNNCVGINITEHHWHSCFHECM